MRKLSTESADLFAEAVSEERDDESSDELVEDRLQESPVSWSDSTNMAMSDELARIGIDSGIPDVKMAALLDHVSNSDQVSTVVKEALAMGTAARWAGRKGIQAGKGLLNLGAQAGKMTGKATLGAGKGVNSIGKASRQGLRNRGKDLSANTSTDIARFGFTGGMEAYGLKGV